MRQLLLAGVIAALMSVVYGQTPVSITCNPPVVSAITDVAVVVTCQKAGGDSTRFTFIPGLPNGTKFNFVETKPDIGRWFMTPEDTGRFEVTSVAHDYGPPYQQVSQRIYGYVVAPSSLKMVCEVADGPASLRAAYVNNCEATGGTAPFTWTVAAGVLPDGIRLNSGTGNQASVTGTPSAVGEYLFSIMVSDAAGRQAAQTYLGDVRSALAISTPWVPNGVVGRTYSSRLTAVGGTAPYTWSVSSGSLPAGLILNVDTGTLSGTPSSSAFSSFEVTARDASGLSVTEAFHSMIEAPLSVSCNPKNGPTLAEGASGAAFYGTCNASDGFPPYTWEVSGKVPPGIEIRRHPQYYDPTGIGVSGVATESGPYDFMLTASDSAMPPWTASFTYSGTILPAPNTPTLTAAPPALNLVNPAGRLPYTVRVSSDIPGKFTVTSSPWLYVEVQRNTLPGEFRVSLDRGVAIAPGTLDGEITVVLDAFPKQSLRIPVHATVLNTLAVSPRRLDILVPRGGKATGEFWVDTDGGPVQFAVNSAADYVTVSPSSGLTPAKITVTVDASLDALSDVSRRPSVWVDTPGASNYATPVLIVAQSYKHLPVTPLYNRELRLTSSKPIIVPVPIEGANVVFTVVQDALPAWVKVDRTTATAPTKLNFTITPPFERGYVEGLVRLEGIVDGERLAGFLEFRVHVDPDSTRPQLRAARNAMTSAPEPLALGTPIALFGENLSFGTATAGAELPYLLAGTEVYLLGGSNQNVVRAPLYYASPTQVNILLPYEADLGFTSIYLRRGLDEVTSTPVAVQRTAPVLPTFEDHVLALNLDGSLNSSEHPVSPGSVVSVYMIGGGLMSPPVVNNMPASSSPLSRTVFPVEATIGGKPAQVMFSGLAPGYVGLMQLNLKVPEDLPDGDQMLKVSVDHVPSTDVPLAIRR